MSLTTTTGIALILSTLIYHGGLAYLFARAQFGEVLNVPRGQKLLIIVRHINEYRWGCRLILIGWVAAALGYVMLGALLSDTGAAAISMPAAVLFLLAIASAIVFWVLHVPPTILAAEETARTSTAPAYYEILQAAAESSLAIYQLLALLSTAGFGWALLATGLLPSWSGWAAIGWGLLWAAVHLRSKETIPLLPMVMPVVIGIALLFK
jgi:hypothetical protein